MGVPQLPLHLCNGGVGLCPGAHTSALAFGPLWGQGSRQRVQLSRYNPRNLLQPSGVVSPRLLAILIIVRHLGRGVREEEQADKEGGGA